MAGEAAATPVQPKPKAQQGCLSTADPTVFRLQFLGSVEVEEEGGRKRRKRLKKHMVEEAVTKIKVSRDVMTIVTRLIVEHLQAPPPCYQPNSTHTT